MLDYAVWMKRIIFLYFICTSPLLAAETGYRVVHPDGTIEFTDQPVKGAVPITLPELPTYSSPATPASGVSKPEVGKKASNQQGKAVEHSISISSPRAEETVFFNASGMSVSVQVSPKLADNEVVVIRLDGSEAARGHATSFTLKDVYRGTHMLSASLIDSQGTVISESSPITFYMRQRSIK